MDMAVLTNVILVILGLIFAFWGAMLIEVAAKIVGAIIGALIGYYVFTIIATQWNDGENWFMESYPTNFTIGTIIFTLIFALIFAYLAFALLKGFVAFALAAAAFYICSSMLNDPPSPLQTGELDMLWLVCIIVAIVVYLFVRIYFVQLLAYGTAVAGGFIVYTGLDTLIASAGGNPDIGVVVALFIGMMLAGFGAKYQLTGRLTDRKDPEPQPPPRQY